MPAVVVVSPGAIVVAGPAAVVVVAGAVVVVVVLDPQADSNRADIRPTATTRISTSSFRFLTLPP